MGGFLALGGDALGAAQNGVQAADAHMNVPTDMNVDAHDTTSAGLQEEPPLTPGDVDGATPEVPLM